VFVQAADAAIEVNDTVHSQNIELCADDNDFNNTDKKYINSDIGKSVVVL
jgi:hypothetical protein